MGQLPWKGPDLPGKHFDVLPGGSVVGSCFLVPPAPEADSRPAIALQSDKEVGWDGEEVP